MSLKGQLMEVNGLRFNVVIAGDGPDVILLHGFPDSALLWRSQIPALVNAGFRVVAPDLRGCGGSDAPEAKADYTMDRLVRDVTGLMDLLGIGRAAMVGHDWGAILGWFVAMEHPERLDRYVALSVGHPAAYRRAGTEQMLRSWYAASFQVPVLPEIAARSFNWLFMRTLTRNHPEMGNWISDKSREGRLTAGMNWYRANFTRMLFGRVAPVRVPVLGMWSDGDIYLTERQMKLSTLYVDAPWRYERIGNSSHWIPLDAPARLNALLLDFLRAPAG